MTESARITLSKTAKSHIEYCTVEIQASRDKLLKMTDENHITSEQKRIYDCEQILEMAKSPFDRPFIENQISSMADMLKFYTTHEQTQEQRYKNIQKCVNYIMDLHDALSELQLSELS